MTCVVGPTIQNTLKRNIFTSDVAVQTESVLFGFGAQPQALDEFQKLEASDDDEFQLASSDLSAILKWSKDISSDINLSSG